MGCRGAIAQRVPVNVTVVVSNSKVRINYVKFLALVISIERSW